MNWIWFLLGAVVTGPLWFLVIRRSLRRTIAHTRQLAAQTRQQEHLVEIGTLTGGLAHEIKNPLSTIKVNLQLLVEDLDSPLASEQHKRWLRRLRAVNTEVDRMQDTLQDFLRYAGRMEINPVRADVRDVISDLVDFFSPQAEGYNVRVRMSVGENPLFSRIDVDMLKQAILNIMINSQQAMADGGELMIKLSPLNEKKRLMIEIIDTGPGMDEEISKNIFKAYYTTKRGGTGLGLPMAHRIIRAHEGHIHLDTAKQKGTRFVIELPVCD